MKGSITATGQMLSKAEKEALTRSRKTRRLRETMADYSFALPLVIFMLAFMIYPLLYNIVLSFRDVQLSNFIQGAQPFEGDARRAADWLDEPDHYHQRGVPVDFQRRLRCLHQLTAGGRHSGGGSPARREDSRCIAYWW